MRFPRHGVCVTASLTPGTRSSCLGAAVFSQDTSLFATCLSQRHLLLCIAKTLCLAMRIALTQCDVLQCVFLLTLCLAMRIACDARRRCLCERHVAKEEVSSPKTAARGIACVSLLTLTNLWSQDQRESHDTLVSWDQRLVSWAREAGVFRVCVVVRADVFLVCCR